MERFTVKFGHQRTDGCEETAGAMQAHTHILAHTQGSLRIVCTVPGRTNTQLAHVHLYALIHKYGLSG